MTLSVDISELDRQDVRLIKLDAVTSSAKYKTGSNQSVFITGIIIPHPPTSLCPDWTIPSSDDNSEWGAATSDIRQVGELV